MNEYILLSIALLFMCIVVYFKQKRIEGIRDKQLIDLRNAIEKKGLNLIIIADFKKRATFFGDTQIAEKAYKKAYHEFKKSIDNYTLFVSLHIRDEQIIKRTWLFYEEACKILIRYNEENN